MDYFFLGVNLIVFIGLILLLVFLQYKKVGFSKRVFLGLVLGIAFGVILNISYGSDSTVVRDSIAWFNLVGRGYIKLLQMLVVPLVFISILAAFTKITIGKQFGKIALSILTVLIATTAIAALIGIGSTMLFNLDAQAITQGETELARGAQMEQTYEEIKDRTLPDYILDLLPSNAFLDFTGQRATSTIGIVIFATFLGFSYLSVRRRKPDIAGTIDRGIQALYELVMGLVRIVIRLTPYGILAIITGTTSTSNFATIYSLGKFLVASYFALAIVFIIHLIILTLNGLNPITYVKKSAETLLFAFSSRSSAATLPLNIHTQTKKFGVSDGIANFSGSFGLSIGQNGCAGVYPAMLAVMIAPTVGQPIDLSFVLMLVVVIAISSFGIAGVGGGATFAAIIVLSILNFPIALAGILISVEPLIDMGRTAVNVSGSMVAGLTTAKRTNQLDESIYRDERLMEEHVEVS